MSVFKIYTLGGIESSKNIATYKATAETKMGALVSINETNKTFTAVCHIYLETDNYFN